VPDPSAAHKIIKSLHTARISGDLPGMVRLFSEKGQFQILGASADKPIAIQTVDIVGFKPWLAMLVKVFRVNNYELLTLTTEWPRVVAHWRADIYSKVTGVSVATELVDIAEVDGERILSYTEFFAPR
jgi:ketosteroid isomerase-like protein